MPFAEPPYPWIKIAVYQSCDNVGCLNQFYYSPISTPAPYSPSDADTFLLAWAAEVIDNWVAASSSSLLIGTVICTVADAANRYEASYVAAEPGTKNNDALPAQDVVVIRWSHPRTGTSRLNPGRSSFSGMTEVDVAGSQINAIDLALYALLAGALLVPHAAGGEDHGLAVFSPTHSQLSLVTDSYVNPTIKTLRSRRLLG